MKLNYSRRELEALGEPINPELPTPLERKAGGGGKGSAPPPPDYAGAAEKQAQASMDVTKYQTQANRPNIVTPWGAQTWTGGEDNNWTQTTTLAPEAQNALDSQLAIQQGRSDIALGLMPHAEEAITRPIDYENMQQFGSAPTASEFGRMGDAPQLQTEFDRSGIPEMPTYNQEYVQNIQNQALDYMRPEMQAAQESLDAQLAAQGITPGSEAYDRAQRRLADQQSRDQYNALNTAMSQGNQMYANQLAANSQGFGQNMAAFQFGNNAKSQQQGLNQNALGFNNQIANQEFGQQQAISDYENTLRQAQIAEAQMRQQQPLNNINALITGQQVAMPNMPAFNTAQRAQAPQYLNAANMQGNYAMQAQQMNNASANSFMNGAFGFGGKLGGAFLGNPAVFGG